MSGNNGVSIEGAAIGLLRQLKDKLAAVKTESSKWTKLQDIMTDLLSKLLSSLENYQDRERIKTLLVENVAKSNIEDGSEVNESLNSDEDDIVRGLQLLFRQVKKKKENLQESIDKSRKKFVNFTSIAQDLVDVLSKYQSVVESAGLLLGSNTEDEMTENEVKQLSMKTILTNRLQDCHERIHVLLSANTPESNSINSKTNKNVKSYDDVIRDALVLSSKSNKDIKEDVHNQQFISNYDIGSENMLQLVEKDEIVFSFAKATIVSELTLQGGKVIVTKPNDKYDEKKCNKSESKLPINPVVEEDRNSHGGSSNDMTNYNNIVLPCGLSLSTMNGEDLSLTAKGLGESIDWVTLLKKNPPEKFLKRPPVRFIFDVIKFISISNPGFLSNNLESSAWEEVGEDKVSKVKFMEEVIDLSFS